MRRWSYAYPPFAPLRVSSRDRCRAPRRETFPRPILPPEAPENYGSLGLILPSRQIFGNRPEHFVIRECRRFDGKVGIFFVQGMPLVIEFTKAFCSQADNGSRRSTFFSRFNYLKRNPEVNKPGGVVHVPPRGITVNDAAARRDQHVVAVSRGVDEHLRLKIKILFLANFFEKGLNGLLVRLFQEIVDIDKIERQTLRQMLSDMCFPRRGHSDECDIHTAFRLAIYWGSRRGWFF